MAELALDNSADDREEILWDRLQEIVFGLAADLMIGKTRWDPVLMEELAEVSGQLVDFGYTAEQIKEVSAQFGAKVAQFHQKLRGPVHLLGPDVLAPKVKASQAIKEKPLKGRELNIWKVIESNPTLRGLAYCHALAAANVQPLRTGIWENCPRKYTSAYLEQDRPRQSGPSRPKYPWRHRIQDEKSDIQRRARATGLASEQTYTLRKTRIKTA